MFKKYITTAKTIVAPVKLLAKGAVSYERHRKGFKAIGLNPIFVPEEFISTDSSFVNSKCKLLLNDTTTPNIVGVYYNPEKGYRLFVNDAFNKQPEWFRKALICFEEGHYNLGHFSDDCTKPSLQKELEADDYALKRGHDILSAHMITIKHNSYFVLDADFITRIETVLNKVDSSHPQYTEALNVIKAYKLAIKLKMIKGINDEA